MTPSGHRQIVAGQQATVGRSARQTYRPNEAAVLNVANQSDDGDVVVKRARIVGGHSNAIDGNVDGCIGTVVRLRGGGVFATGGRIGCVDAIDVVVGVVFAEPNEFAVWCDEENGM